MSTIGKRLLQITLMTIPIFAIGLFVFSWKADATDYNVTGTISTNTTWTTGNRYIMTGHVTVASGVTLTVEPGVEVRANGNYYFQVYGTLDVNGTIGSEVLFTHHTSTTVGAWYGVYIRNNGTAYIDYAKFYYADTGLRIYEDNATATVNDSLFNSCELGISVFERGSLTTARNTFNKQLYTPIELNTDVYSVTLGAGTDADVLGTGTDVNGYNAIGIGLTDSGSNNCPSDICSIPQRTFAGISNISYIILNQYTVNDSTSGAKLQIDGGVLVKGRKLSLSNGYLSVQSGCDLDINGSSGNEVIFTSEYDDSQGGDTNNDGTATSPSTTNWYGIFVDSGCTATIDYGKFYYQRSIKVNGTNTSATIYDSLFELNETGIDVYERASLTTARNTFNKMTYTPIVLNPDVLSISLGTGSDADVLGTGANVNGYNAIGISLYDSGASDCPSNICDIPQRTFAGISNIPYVMIDSYTVNDPTAGAKLEIDAGVIIKVRKLPLSNAILQIQNGCDLDINGSSGNEVIFTSEYDDTIAGDTNNDSSATSPSVSNWTGFSIAANCSATVDYAKIFYHDRFIVTGAGSSAVINDTLFELGRVGISVSEQASLTTSRNTFKKLTFAPIDLNPDVLTVIFGSGTNVDIIGTGSDINGYNGILVGYSDSGSSSCPLDICEFPQRTFAGISNIPYVIYDNYEISDSTAGAKLEIDPGVIIKFRRISFTNGYLRVRAGTSLDVNGSEGNEVIFTSEYDDTFGGDTNNDGSATTPSIGEWDSIMAANSSSATVDYSKIYYADRGLRVYDYSSATVQDSLFESCQTGISIYEHASLTTARNTFNKQSIAPIELNPDYVSLSLGSGASTDIVGTDANANSNNVILTGWTDTGTDDCISNICTFDQKTFAGITNWPYHMNSDYTFNGSDDTVVFDPGVIMKSTSNVDLVVTSGASLDVNGTLNNMVYFTSLKNDYIGGDTNNDGTATLPSRADWNSLDLRGAGTHSLDYVDISYGHTAYFNNTATNVTISNSNSRINTYGGYFNSGSAPTFSALNIVNNYSYGYYNNTSTVLTMENLWWGAADGPNDADAGGQCSINSTLNNSVNDDASHPIDYCPFATTEFRIPTLTTNSVTDVNENSGVGNANISSYGYYHALNHGQLLSTSNQIVYLDPIVEWQMDDNADDSVVTDFMGNYNATFTGGGGTDNYTSSHSVTGVIDSALTFDGVNDVVSATIPKPSLPITIAFWVNSDVDDPVGMFDSGPNVGYVFRNYEAGKVEWHSNDPEVTLNLTADTWYHLTFVYEIYGGKRRLTYYRNGTLQQIAVGSDTTSFGWTTFNIGNINNGSAGRFAGEIDDFRIFDYSLNQAEIDYLYNSGDGHEGLGYEVFYDNGQKLTTGVYTTSLTSLEEATTYYTRAFVNRTDGLHMYGDVVNFTTTGGNSLPVASNVSIDADATEITLTESTTTEVVCTATVADVDGYGNITSVEAKLFRTGVGESSADDDNNHYTVSGDSECVPSGGSGSVEYYTCTFNVYYHADPTDAGTYETDDWTCQVTPTDTVGAGTSDTDTIEMATLIAMSAADSLDYDSLDRGNNTGSTNFETTITNTGNGEIDIQVSGSDMCTDYPTCSGSIITVNNQQYSTTPFTYGSGSVLSASSTPVDINLTKPTANPSNATFDLEWGISVPSYALGYVHHGENIFTAIPTD